MFRFLFVGFIGIFLTYGFFLSFNPSFTIVSLGTDTRTLYAQVASRATVPKEPLIVPTSSSSPTKILFVGDIMLGRHVEERLLIHGALFPFEYVLNDITNADYAIGNFEGVVPETHVPTPDFGFRFSIQKEYLSALSDVGFDILSLANNHSADFGSDAVSHTRSLCREYELTCVGSAYPRDGIEYTVHPYIGGSFSILVLNTVFEEPDDNELLLVLEEMSKVSNLQFVYVHWGDEYELIHNKREEELAHFLIDSGADLIVGHHPHVIQDVEFYNGVPIFYSLGNFVFDQFFEKNVMEGLMLELVLDKDAFSYTIIPVTSEYSHTQPQRMNTEDTTRIILRVMENSGISVPIDPRVGTFFLER